MILNPKMGLRLATFLYISKAYVFDTVDQGILWKSLRELGLDEKNTELLRTLCSKISVQVAMGGTQDEADASVQRPETGVRSIPPVFYAICSI